MPQGLSPSFLNYDRTVIAFHGTDQETAAGLVRGNAFVPSERDIEWLGTGIYFWEQAPKQAWYWAREIRKHQNPAVVGALVRLGNCFDLGDPGNSLLLAAFKEDMERGLGQAGQLIPTNHRKNMKLDCAVFNHVYNESRSTQPIDSFRAVFVPTDKRKRIWAGSWIYGETHVQICVRDPSKILAVWHVKENGSYGLDR